MGVDRELVTFRLTSEHGDLHTEEDDERRGREGSWNDGGDRRADDSG